MTWTSFGLFNEEDTWGNLRRLQKEVGQFFESAASFNAGEFPAVNVWSGNDKVVVAVELPGIDQKDIDVTVLGRTLTIRGERKMHQPDEGQSFIRRERHGGSFARSLELPFEVRSEEVTAEYVNGVLKIQLPKAETQKARKIAIK